MNKKESLIQYIQALQEQQKTQESKNGITLWGIGAGVIYIAWQIIGKITDLQENAETSAQFIELLSPFSIIAVCAIMLIQNYSSNSRSALDYRFSPATRNINITPGLAIVFSPAIFLSFLSTYFFEPSSTAGFSKLCGYTLSVIIALLFTAEISLASKKEMPDVSSLSIAQRSAAHKFLSTLFIVTFAAAGIFATYKIALGISTKIYAQYQIEAAFNICLIPICLYIAREIHNNGKKSLDLSKLQRDIFIHDITTDEIENRLKEEFVGLQFDEWLESELEKIQRKIEDLSKVIDGYENIKDSISQIAQNLKYERDGQKNEYKKRILDSYSDYFKAFGTLDRWIDRALRSQVSKDSYLKERLSEIKTSINNTSNTNKITVSKILEDLSSI
ncbi:hypothetical protein [Pseudomonas sp. PDM19]|uniref:hypothetical protein n=1 Tax=Pseudomonas sp. PDM19 TaxID=2769272 RepID=UPI0017864A64|nr:hypothetical protein [Pseudomonas sp. PDM19]MBD9632804.1 hypothetical protein [Pseudomonas sp. PDM19]